MDHLFDIAIFILVLGELVFFHELGHFLAAKACGIYCERFSLGMPPRLFGFKFGETDYCVGLLPIGGYVKMAGQEDVPLSEDERKQQYGSIPPERWFMNKPVWQRVIVIAAGPFMNIVLAILIYASLVGFGAYFPEQKYDNRIGRIEEKSPAATAPLFVLSQDDAPINFNAEPDAQGWRTGDRIVAIDGKPVSNISEVAIEGILAGGELVVATIERAGPEGETTRYLSPIQPRALEGSEHVRLGIQPFNTALVKYVLDDMPADDAGIQKGDLIQRVNGEIVDTNTFRDVVSESGAGESVEADILRDGEHIKLAIEPRVVGSFEDIFIAPPMDWEDHIDYNSPLNVVEQNAELLAGSGFQTGDTVLTVNGEKVTSAVMKKLQSRPHEEKLQVVVEREGLFGVGEPAQVTLPDVDVQQFLQAVTPFDIKAEPTILGIAPSLAKTTGLKGKDIIEEVNGEPATLALLREVRDEGIGQSVRLKVRRPALGYGVMRDESFKEAELTIAKAGVVGIYWDETKAFYRAPVGQIVPQAMRETWKMIKLTLRTLQTLLTGGISAKELGGPIMIYQATTNAAKFSGYVGLMETTAFISVNLAIFNLLPLPVLDGGHLLFLAIESIRRKPVSAKVMEWVQQAGLVLIIGLMLFATFNDIKRWVENFIP